MFPIQVPPLRERREDFPDLIKYFMHHIARRINKPVSHVSPATLGRFSSYNWPGNVRELENVIERAMIVASGDTLEIDEAWLKPATRNDLGQAPGSRLSELERRAILEALASCHGKIYGPNGAAACLGLKPTTLYGKMRKHQIAKPIPGQ